MNVLANHQVSVAFECPTQTTLTIHPNRVLSDENISISRAASYSSHQLYRRGPCSAVACRQNAKSSICLLINANIVRQYRQEVQARLDPSKCPFRRGKQLYIAKASYEQKRHVLATKTMDALAASLYQYSQLQRRRDGPVNWCLASMQQQPLS
jgi:hypothetical protein